MLHQTIEKLHALKLSAMADGLLAQSRQPGIEALGFEERLALLVDVQHTAAYNAALGQRLKAANLRQTACLEDLDLRTPRGLDRTLVATLASGQWIRTSRSVLLTGPTGVGKTFIACALGHQAARDGFSVLYRRLPRLLDDLAIARVAGRHRSAFAKLARTRLLIIDDWAMTRLTAEQRRDLMEVIDMTGRRRSWPPRSRCPAGLTRSATPPMPTLCWTASFTTPIASSCAVSRCVGALRQTTRRTRPP
jgi:DNA replication protein DnaC